MKYIITSIAIAAILASATPAMAYITKQWLDYTQLAHIQTPSGTIEVYSFKDASNTCYIAAAGGSSIESISCITSSK